MERIIWTLFQECETLVDIRPAHQYAESHIRGAISLPFPIDLKQLKKDHGITVPRLTAVQILQYVTGYENYVLALKELHHPVGLYCQTGGWRSMLLSKILEYPVANVQLRCGMGNRKAIAGSLRTSTFLNGGFNAYLEAFYQKFDARLRFVKVCGLTGSGKTKLLTEIHGKGGQILDFEQLAQHSGSAFGGLYKKKQPDQWSFENKLVKELESFDHSLPVFVEQKNGALGSLHIPTPLFTRLGDGESIILDVPKSRRINNLVQTYGQLPKKGLEKAIHQVSKRLGVSLTKEALTALYKDRLEKCAEILLNYYDQSVTYSNQAGKRIQVKTYQETAQILIDQFTAPIQVSQFEQ